MSIIFLKELSNLYLLSNVYKEMQIKTENSRILTHFRDEGAHIYYDGWVQFFFALKRLIVLIHK